MKKLLVFVSLIFVANFAQAQDDIADSVVKIYAAHLAPDYANPWRQHPLAQSSASGAFVKVQGKNCIITNAHAIARSTFVQVKHSSRAKKYQAQVWFVSHDADLALLTLEDQTFFDGLKALEFGELPSAQSEVLLYGFPLGGTALSITKGILSRIDYQPYAHSKKTLIVGQIDAAMNPGNSGGPIIVDDKIVGLAMQSLAGARSENISYMIPDFVIKHFLKDISDGRFDGIPELGVEVQKIENPSLKSSLGLDEDRSGLLVTYVYPESSAYGKFKVGDVILKIDGKEVGDDAKVNFRHQERISAGHFVDQAQIGDHIEQLIWREGKEHKVTIKLEDTWRDFYLVKSLEYEDKPKYYIYGGLVFTVLNQNLLSTFRNQPPINFLYMVEQRASEEKNEIVVLQNVLQSSINRGYEEMRFSFVEKVNGKSFYDFDEFVDLLEKNKEDYVDLYLDNDASIILSRKAVEENDADILKTYRIQYDRSEDLRN